MITWSRDDGLVRTHEEMRQVLAYAVPGARVRLYKPRTVFSRSPDATMAYEITITRGGPESLALVGSYCLEGTPPSAEGIIANTRKELRKRAGE